MTAEEERYAQRSLPTRAGCMPFLLLVALLCTACSHRHRTQAARQFPVSPAPRKQSPVNNTFPVGYREEGIASWYGVPYHGRPAADGEIYDMETLVAAHRLMPFNTWIRVTNLRNAKTAELRVIDRGPFVDGRILDVSKAAARQLELLGSGIGRVQIEVIRAPGDVPSNDFYAVQIAAFASRENAERARAQFAARYGSAEIVLKQGNVSLYRVLVGRGSLEQAKRLALSIGENGEPAFVVRLDSTVTGAAGPD